MKILTKREAEAVIVYIVKLEERLDTFELWHPDKSLAADRGIEKLIYLMS